MAATSNMTTESVPLAVIPTIDPSGLNRPAGDRSQRRAKAELLGWLSRGLSSWPAPWPWTDSTVD